jgi:PilZ domain
MSAMEQPKHQNTTAQMTDRRRHPRHRFSSPITVRDAAGKEWRGITIEISQSGISVVVKDSLKLGDRFELEPIAGGKVFALVRHKTGVVHGFEFVDLTSEQVQRLKETCEKLPRFQTRLSN